MLGGTLNLSRRDEKLSSNNIRGILLEALSLSKSLPPKGEESFARPKMGALLMCGINPHEVRVPKSLT